MLLTSLFFYDNLSITDSVFFRSSFADFMIQPDISRTIRSSLYMFLSILYKNRAQISSAACARSLTPTGAANPLEAPLVSECGYRAYLMAVEDSLGNVALVKSLARLA